MRRLFLGGNISGTPSPSGGAEGCDDAPVAVCDNATVVSCTPGAGAEPPPHHWQPHPLCLRGDPSPDCCSPGNPSRDKPSGAAPAPPAPKPSPAAFPSLSMDIPTLFHEIPPAQCSLGGTSSSPSTAVLGPCPPLPTIWAPWLLLGGTGAAAHPWSSSMQDQAPLVLFLTDA